VRDAFVTKRGAREICPRLCEELQTLSEYLVLENLQSGDISPRRRQASDETLSGKIIAGSDDHNRGVLRFGLGDAGRSRAWHHKYVNFLLPEFSGGRMKLLG
jgi:hypothetical protein